VRHHPLGEKLPPNIQPKRPLSQFKTSLPCHKKEHPTSHGHGGDGSAVGPDDLSGLFQP